MVSCIAGLIIAIPIIQLSLTPDARIRFEKTNVMKYHQSVLDAWDRYTVAREGNDTIGKIINNPKIAGIKVVIKQYVLHFNPYWLFYWDTKPEDHKISGLGLLFFWEAPLIVYGLYVLLKQKKYYPMNFVILGTMEVYMMSDIKERIITAIRDLPDDATYEDIFELLYVQEKVAKVLQNSDEGQYISQTEFEEKYRKSG